MRTKYINDREYLLVKVTSKASGTYLPEAAKQTYATIADVVAEIDDDWVKVWRFDEESETLENITEELAAAYIDANPGTGEDTAPLFVRNSEAMDLHLASFEPPINMRREYGTYSTYQGKVA